MPLLIPMTTWVMPSVSLDDGIIFYTIAVTRMIIGDIATSVKNSIATSIVMVLTANRW